MDEQQSGTGARHRKLFKSTTDRIVDGVCGGVAEYLGIEPTVIRLLLVAFTILSIGAGVVFYIVAMIVIPSKPISLNQTGEESQHASRSSGGATITLVLGILVVIIGVTLLFDYYDVLPVTIAFHRLGRLALPIIFILVGGAILLGKERRSVTRTQEEGEFTELGVEKKRLARSSSDRKLAGVCGGIAEYLEVDPTIVRLVCILLALASFGLVLVLYLACILIIPKEVR